jgi:hypothetical protein
MENCATFITDSESAWLDKGIAVIPEIRAANTRKLTCMIFRSFQLIR